MGLLVLFLQPSESTAAHQAREYGIIWRIDISIDTAIDLWCSEFARGTACHVTDDLGLACW